MSQELGGMTSMRGTLLRQTHHADIWPEANLPCIVDAHPSTLIHIFPHPIPIGQMRQNMSDDPFSGEVVRVLRSVQRTFALAVIPIPAEFHRLVEPSRICLFA